MLFTDKQRNKQTNKQRNKQRNKQKDTCDYSASLAEEITSNVHLLSIYKRLWIFGRLTALHKLVFDFNFTALHWHYLCGQHIQCRNSECVRELFSTTLPHTDMRRVRSTQRRPQSDSETSGTVARVFQHRQPTDVPCTFRQVARASCSPSCRSLPWTFKHNGDSQLYTEFSFTSLTLQHGTDSRNDTLRSQLTS